MIQRQLSDLAHQTRDRPPLSRIFDSAQVFTEFLIEILIRRFVLEMVGHC